MTADRKTEWHLDRRVTVSMMCLLLFQAAALLIWGASLSAQVVANTDTTARHERVLEKQRDDAGGIREGLAGVEAKLESLVDQVSRLADRLDRAPAAPLSAAVRAR